jgi:hypothetical protein
MADGPRKHGRKRDAQPYAFSDFEGAEWLFRLAIGAALSGGALRIGLSRDGGALAIGVYMGDDYGTEYVRPNDDLAMAVREIAQLWSIPCAVPDETAGRWILPR